MNTQQIKSILEISLLQNMNSLFTNSTSSDETSLFSTIFDEFLTEMSTNLTGTDSSSQSSTISTDQTQRLLSNTTAPNIKIADEHLQSIIQKAAKTYNLPESLLRSVIKQESNFQINAVSSSGARGLMQLMPATAKSLGVENIDDPQENVMAGAKYLRKLLNRYGSLDLALAAYNAGPGNVDKYNGIPPFKETQNYVTKILNSYLNA